MKVLDYEGAELYKCELCPATTEDKQVGWVSITTEYGDNHLCPKCWEPVVPKGDGLSSRGRLMKVT